MDRAIGDVSTSAATDVRGNRRPRQRDIQGAATSQPPYWCPLTAAAVSPTSATSGVPCR
jgi:hypothetical protein